VKCYHRHEDHLYLTFLKKKCFNLDYYHFVTSSLSYLVFFILIYLIVTPFNHLFLISLFSLLSLYSLLVYLTLSSLLLYFYLKLCFLFYSILMSILIFLLLALTIINYCPMFIYYLILLLISHLFFYFIQ
jgi:hypothetical protein